MHAGSSNPASEFVLVNDIEQIRVSFRDNIIYEVLRYCTVHNV